jgi:adenosylcobinamide-GDP ribazoletransferase
MRKSVTQLLACLRFYSRLPLPGAAAPVPFDADAIWAVPVAGALIGVVSTIVLAVATLVLPVGLAAVLAVATLVAVTGALHEDGLADCADAQGAAAPARKLEIMRDSRIGSFGALALAFDVVLRVGALASIAARSPWLAMTVLLAAAAVSRTAGLLPAYLLPPARPDGAGAALGKPLEGPLLVGLVIAALVGFGPLLAGAGFGRCLAAMTAATAVAGGAAAVAKRQIGGFTGDVLGAAQQVAEIAVYLAFAAA